MSILDILEAHTVKRPWSEASHMRCKCGEVVTAELEAQLYTLHRAHVAQVLEQHEREREAAAKAEHRREWADHISEWHATVGAPICHVEAVVQALRSDHVPFGKGATNGRG